MIFFARTRAGANGIPVIEIAVVESEQTAARYETQGFQRCSFAAFREAWRLRDMHDLERQRLVNSSTAEQPGAAAETVYQILGPRIYDCPA
jgi:hypothetical protein